MTDTTRAIAAMIAAMGFFVTGDTLMKIVGGNLPIGEMLLIRGSFASLFIVGIAVVTGALARIGMIATPRILVRTLAEVGCSVLYFLALIRMSLADAAAISQFTPLAVMAGAALFLSEPVGWRRWSAAAVGLVGVLLVIKPGTSAFQPAALLMLGSTLLVAVRDLVTRGVPSSVPTVLIAASATVAVTVTGLLMAPFEVWRPPTTREIAMLAICALTVVLGFLLVIGAMRTGALGVISPFRYSYIVLATLASIVVFADTPDRWSLTGIVLIVLSGLYMLHRERTLGRIGRAAGSGASPAPAAPSVATGRH